MSQGTGYRAKPGLSVSLTLPTLEQPYLPASSTHSRAHAFITSRVKSQIILVNIFFLVTQHLCFQSPCLSQDLWFPCILCWICEVLSPTYLLLEAVSPRRGQHGDSLGGSFGIENVQQSRRTLFEARTLAPAMILQQFFFYSFLPDLYLAVALLILINSAHITLGCLLPLPLFGLSLSVDSHTTKIFVLTAINLQRQKGYFGLKFL